MTFSAIIGSLEALCGEGRPTDGYCVEAMIVTCWWRAYLRPGFLDPVDRMSSVVAGTEGYTIRSCWLDIG